MKQNLSAIHSPLLNRADKIGSVLSSLCAVHCLCMPVLIGLLPVIGLTFLASHTFEQIASVSMIVLAAACVWTGCRYHRRWGLLALLAVGAAVVMGIQFAGPAEADETQTDWFEAAAMMTGGLLIATSHLLNLKLRARCHCSQCEAETKSSVPAKGTRP